MDIEELQSLLAGAFEQKSTVRLSERNVVELVCAPCCAPVRARRAVLSAPRVGEQAEGVRPARLRLAAHRQRPRVRHPEAAAAGHQGAAAARRRSRGGACAARVRRRDCSPPHALPAQVADLPALVSVDLVHCERQAVEIAAEPGGEARLVEGELLTERYWDGLAGEVDEELRAAGSASLGDLARRYGLSVELITSALVARLGTLVHGRLESGLLYTDAHVKRLAAQLRGALRATASPCSVQELAAAAFESGTEAGACGGIAPVLVAELVASGAAAGALRSGGLLWTPAVHARRQRDAVAAFYAGNGLVSYEVVRRAGVSQPRAWLSAQHPEGVHLDSAMVAPALLEQLDAAVEEALASAGWADVAAHLPPSLGPPDAVAAASRSPVVARTVRDGGALRAESCVVNAAFLDAAADVAKAAGRSAGAAAAGTRKSGAGATPDASTPPSALKGRGARSRRSDVGSGSDGDDDDWSTGPKSKGKGGKGARGKGGKGGATPSPTAVLRPQASEPAVCAPSTAQLQQQLESAFAAVAHAGEGALSSALAEHLHGAAAAAFAAAEKEALSEGADERRRALEVLTQRADASFAQLQLLARGAELFASDEATALLLAKHVLKSAGADVADALLRLLNADGMGAQAATPAALTDKLRTQLVQDLPAELRAAGAALLEALAGRAVAPLEAALEPLASACGLRLKPLDKKAERALLQAHRRALSAQFAAETEPPAALLLAVPLLYATCFGRALSLPGRGLGAAIARLSDQLTPDEHRTLSVFQEAVVELLQLRGDESDAGKAAAQAKGAALAAQLPQLQQLVQARSHADAN